MPADAVTCDPAFTSGLVVGLGLGCAAVLVVLVLTFLAMHRDDREKAAALAVGTIIVALMVAYAEGEDGGKT